MKQGDTKMELSRSCFPRCPCSWMKPGDVCEVEAKALLRHPIVEKT